MEGLNLFGQRHSSERVPNKGKAFSMFWVRIFDEFLVWATKSCRCPVVVGEHTMSWALDGNESDIIGSNDNDTTKKVNCSENLTIWQL